MADYIEIKDAAGTVRKVSVDEVASQLVQRFKVQFGSDNSAADVTAGNPLPVSDATALAQLEILVAELEILSTGTLKVAGIGTSNNVRIEGIVKGDLDADSVDGNAPVKVGGKARTSLVAVSAAGDRTDLSTDKLGRVFGIAAPLEQRFKGNLNRTNNTAGQLVAAPGANVALVVTNVKVVNGHATVGSKVELIEGESTQLDVGYAGPLGGGWVMENKDGLYPPLAANTKLQAKCATTGADVDIFVSGYKVPA